MLPCATQILSLHTLSQLHWMDKQCFSSYPIRFYYVLQQMIRAYPAHCILIDLLYWNFNIIMIIWNNTHFIPILNFLLTIFRNYSQEFSFFISTPITNTNMYFFASWVHHVTTKFQHILASWTFYQLLLLVYNNPIIAWMLPMSWTSTWSYCSCSYQSLELKLYLSS